MTTPSPTEEQKTRMEILSIFGEDDNITNNESLLCYCDVPALVLTSKGANNHNRTLATCSKFNELGFRCNMWEWFYNDTSEPQCKIQLQMRRDTYKLRLNRGPIPLSEYKGKLYNGYPLCFCGQFCKTGSVREGPHAGKKFYACVYYDEGRIGGCKFFRWVDSKKASPQLDNETTFGEVKKSSIQFHPSLERMKIELQEVNKELHISSEIMIKLCSLLGIMLL
ncbi:hypothetical protein ACFE04_023897 [Oxalis oulophora]